jgi:hypothetical protein
LNVPVVAARTTVHPPLLCRRDLFHVGHFSLGRDVTPVGRSLYFAFMRKRSATRGLMDGHVKADAGPGKQKIGSP